MNRSPQTMRRPADDADTVATTDPLAINHLPGSNVRYASLDAIRGIAALSVILYHTTWPTHAAATTFAGNTYTAVDLFFLLSGFVIAAAYRTRVSTGREIGAFFERRIFRVYPLQWAVLAWLVAIELAKLAVQLGTGHPPGAQAAFTGNNSVPLLAVNLLLLQGTGLFPETSWNPPSWSVSAEIVAYAVFAATGYLGLLRNRWFITAIACAGLVAYAALAWHFDTLNLTADFGIVRCLAGFPIGVALFQVTAGGRLAWLEGLSGEAATALEALVVLGTAVVLATMPDGFVVLAIPCYAALIALFQMERGVISRALRARPFQVLGAISYSIYLIHVPVRGQIVNVARYLGVPSHRTVEGRLILDIGPLAGDALLLLFLLITVVLAAVTFRFIEEPARLFGRRLSSRISTSAS